MKDVYYYKVPFDSSKYYKVKEDGHLFLFDFNTFKWTDVSTKTPYNAGWQQISENELTQSLLQVYQTLSKWYIEDIFCDDEDEEEINFGDVFTYYKKGERVVCVDDKDNQYECRSGAFDVLELNALDDSWTKLEAKDVIDAINKEDGYVSLKEMELYTDENNDVVGFAKNGKQYRLDTVSGDLIRNQVVIEPNEGWKKIEYSYVENLKGDVTTYLNEKALKDSSNTTSFLEDYSENLKRYNKVELGKHLTFYKNGFDEVFMTDENGNEYSYNLRGIGLEEKGTIDKENYQRVKYEDADEIVCFVGNRIDELSKGDSVTLYDLDLYKDEKGKLFGIDREGKTYILNEKGDVTLSSESFTKASKASRIEAIQLKAKLLAQWERDSFFEMVNDKLKSTPEIKPSQYFYHRFGERITLYIKDEIEREARLTIDRIELVEKGYMDNEEEDFIPIKDDEFMLYYLEANKADLEMVQEREHLNKENYPFLLHVLDLTKDEKSVWDDEDSDLDDDDFEFFNGEEKSFFSDSGSDFFDDDDFGFGEDIPF